MYIAKKEGFAGTWDYFQDNVNDSPKWTKNKEKAKSFSSKEDALCHSNVSNLYEIYFEEI